MMVKRTFDIAIAFVALGIFVVPMLVLTAVIRITSRGPAIYWSRRVGRNNEIFLMPKLRTMQVDTPQLATHLLTGSDHWITPIGHFLRKTSLDELPQLLSILWGDMSFVGPRPALFNQHDLTAQRTALGVHRLLPGLTGWAQVNGRDELEIPEKVAFDLFYLNNRSLAFDAWILLLTAIKVLRRDGIKQAGEASRNIRVGESESPPTSMAG